MSVQQYPFLCAPVCCRSLDLCSSFLILALRHAAVIFLHHQTSDFSLPLLSPSCRTLATSLLGQARIIWAVLFALWSTLLKISQLLWNILQRSYSVYGDLSWFQLYFQILFSGCCCWLFSPPPPAICTTFLPSKIVTLQKQNQHFCLTDYIPTLLHTDC